MLILILLFKVIRNLGVVVQVSRCREATVGQELLHDVEQVSWHLGVHTPEAWGQRLGYRVLGSGLRGFA